MHILVLNGSPRPDGNTAAMVRAFAKGAEEAGNAVTVVNVCQKRLPDAWPVSTATNAAAGTNGSASSRMICRTFILCWTARI